MEDEAFIFYYLYLRAFANCQGKAKQDFSLAREDQVIGIEWYPIQSNRQFQNIRG